MSSRSAVRAADDVVLVTVPELELQDDHLLFDRGDLTSGVVGAADTGLAPDRSAPHFAEAGFNASDLAGDPGGAGVDGQQRLEQFGVVPTAAPLAAAGGGKALGVVLGRSGRNCRQA
jgi:hypothetical protein